MEYVTENKTTTNVVEVVGRQPVELAGDVQSSSHDRWFAGHRSTVDNGQVSR